MRGHHDQPPFGGAFRPRWFDAPLLALTLLSIPVGPVSAQITWEKRYGGDYNESAECVIQPSGDLAYVAVGSTSSYGPGAPDADNPFIMKIDYRGQLLWLRTHGSTLTDGLLEVQETKPDRGFIMCGYRRVPGRNEDLYVIKTDAGGNMLWDHAYGAAYSDLAMSITQVTDGGYVLTGYVMEGDYPAYAEGCLLKIDAQGSVVLWKRRFIWPRGGLGLKVMETTGGGLIMAGTANFDGPEMSQYVVIWTDATGLPYRTRYYGGAGINRLCSFIRTANGYALLGYVADDPPLHSWPHVITIDRAGQVLWDRAYIATYSQAASDISATQDGGFILTGGTNETGPAADLYIMKLDASGDVEWRERYGAGGGYTDYGNSVLQTRDGGYLAMGCSASGGPGTSIYAVKVGPGGLREAPDARLLAPPPTTDPCGTLQVVPNPFRSMASIPGHEAQPVVLYDIGGRLVGHYEGGRIGADLLPGVYFLKPGGPNLAPVRIVKVP